jgi:predicted phosphodiesterase
MKLVLISDTHGSHRDVLLPRGDVLIHAGDLCDSLNNNLYQQRRQVEDVDSWFGQHQFKKVICIAGKS